MAHHWLSLPVLGLLLHVLYLPTCTGTIECVCTTADCQLEQRTTCQAAYMCYVQYMSPAATLHSPPRRSGETDPSAGALSLGAPSPGAGTAASRPVVRGCIDDRTPLLCENRRPQAYTGSWPVLHCCSERLCNEDILPTDPTWLTADKENALKNSKSDRSILPTIEKDYKQDARDDDDDAAADDVVSGDRQGAGSAFQDGGDAREQKHRTPQGRARALNPLYIGVPVAGACVLLAIIIFAVYVLRRQNQYIEDYRYHSNLRQTSCPHKSMMADLETQCPHNKSGFYAECERSSSGSETKLLMKV